MKSMNDYWSTVVEGNKLYQMGGQSHRIYLLDLLNEKGIMKFLDVGCGTAPLYQLIKLSKEGKIGEKYRWSFDYKGVDPSPAMIESCRYNFPDGDFAVQNATNLLEKDNAWDCLVYMHSFDYIYDYMQALKEAYRVTKKYVCIILWQSLEYGEARTHRLNNSVNGIEPVDWSNARLQHFAWPQLQREMEEVGFKMLLKKDDEEINKEGRNNTLILLEKI